MVASTHSTGSTKAFRDWLQGEIDSLGWTNARLAQELGVTKSTVGKWLAREGSPYQRRPSYDSCLRISKRFGVDSRAILEMAGIEERQGDESLTPLQRDVMSIIPMLNDHVLSIVYPQLRALNDEQTQKVIVNRLKTSTAPHSVGRQRRLPRTSIPTRG